MKKFLALSMAAIMAVGLFAGCGGSGSSSSAAASGSTGGDSAPAQTIKEAARQEGAWFLKDSLMELVRQGKTTLKELIRTTYQME